MRRPSQRSSYRTDIRRHRSGQAMAEFLVITPVFILLIFGSIQLALIFSAKTTLNYATFQAARIGALNNATYSGIRQGLIRGLAPLYTVSNSRTGPDVMHAIQAGINSDGARKDATSEVDAFTRIVRLNPMSSDFSTGNRGHGELNTDGIVQIPNNQLMYRDPGVKGRINVQDANLLKIRVQYCYELIVPIVNKVIGSLSELNNTRNSTSRYETPNDPRFADFNRGYADEMAAAESALASYAELCGGRGLRPDRADKFTGFVISSEATIRMQTAAYDEDPDDTLGSYMCDGDRMSCP